MDLVHYHPKVNSIMLQAIKDKKNIILTDTVDAYIDKINFLAEEYNVNPIGYQIQ
jgi:N-acetylglucosamine-6-phosphate deacetylase